MQGLLPKRLRVLRAERGLTIKQAAESASVTRETLRELELGRRTPHEPTLAKIANAYDVSVAELLEAAEVEPDPLADAPRSSSELESPRRNPDLERLSSNLRDRIRDFLQRWLEVGNYLKRPEGKIPGSHVWHLEQHRNVTREAAILLRDVVELGDYAGVASNVPQLIHATAEKVRLGADLAVARAQLEQAAAWALLQQEIAYDLAKTKQKEEDEYAKVVSLTVERERRRPPDSDDTATARGAG
jgi:transcriptional regulator with XRE-family HTH domain